MSYAEKDNVFSRQCTGFRQRLLYTSLPTKAFPPKQAYVDINVFGWLHKQRPRFAQDQPKGYFQMKELDRTTDAIARGLSMLSPMCQHVACSLSAIERKTKPFPDSIFFWEEGDSGRFA